MAYTDIVHGNISFEHAKRSDNTVDVTLEFRCKNFYGEIKMFKVRWNAVDWSNDIYNVYSVKTDGCKTLFLIYYNGYWSWEDSRCFEPYEVN